MISKKTIYISLFTLLGFLVGLLVHGVVETIYIVKFLRVDYETYSLGLSWDGILVVHGIFSFITFFGGAWLGYVQGKYWWQKIYVEHGLRRWFRKTASRMP